MKSTPACFHGDRDALCTAIYHAQRAKVLAMARSLAGHFGLKSHAEDITQIDFLRFDQVLKRGGFADLSTSNWSEPDQQRRLQAWFFGATVLVVREFRRRHRRKPGIEFNHELDANAPAATDLTPFQTLVVEEARQYCTPTEWESLQLQREGFTSREIALRLERNPSTVRSQQLKARRRIQAYLETDIGDGSPPGLR